MFADVDADVYILVDGDGTYDASSAMKMVNLLSEQHLDMVCGKRIESEALAYRQGHRLGNRVLTGLVGDPVRRPHHRHPVWLPRDVGASSCR